MARRGYYTAVIRHPAQLAQAIDGVVRSDRCMGCGACTHIASDVRMQETAGYLRPVVQNHVPGRDERKLVQEFHRICPGVSVQAVSPPPGGRRDPFLGPVLASWDAWATDPEFRFRGSSGGVISALCSWMVEQEEVSSVVAADNRPDPRRTVPVRITSREQALASAGSRYTQCSTAAHTEAVRSDAAVVAKPCEASSLRRLGRERGTMAPLLFSFFCAGTPSTDATDQLVTSLGVPAGEPLRDLWYRGHGWPGQFTAVTEDGQTVSTSYDDSWGAALGPTVAWRCRVCADGVGESADISAGDHWYGGTDGYPEFSEKEGRSVLIARTPRGLDAIQRAAKAGVIDLEPVDLDHVKSMQPYQVTRRRYLAGRLLATLLFRRSVTTYRGFGLLLFALRSPRRTWAEMRGSASRLKRLSGHPGLGRSAS